MPINSENNKKNEAVKGFLADLFKEFELDEEVTCHRKRIFQKQNNLHQLTKEMYRFALIDSGKNTLKSIQFESVDNIDSVKRLKKAELFFSEPYYLERFKFLEDFKFSDCISQIDSDFSTGVDIEIQLDVLSEKYEKLFRCNPNLAAWEAKYLILDFRNLNRWYFEEEKIDYEEYKSRALTIINEIRPVLEQNLGFKEILVNLIILIVTLGTATLVNKVVNGHFLFFQKPNCSEQIDKLSQTVAQLSL